MGHFKVLIVVIVAVLVLGEAGKTKSRDKKSSDSSDSSPESDSDSSESVSSSSLESSSGAYKTSAKYNNSTTVRPASTSESVTGAANILSTGGATETTSTTVRSVEATSSTGTDKITKIGGTHKSTATSVPTNATKPTEPPRLFDVSTKVLPANSTSGKNIATTSTVVGIATTEMTTVSTLLTTTPGPTSNSTSSGSFTHPTHYSNTTEIPKATTAPVSVTNDTSSPFEKSTNVTSTPSTVSSTSFPSSSSNSTHNFTSTTNSKPKTTQATESTTEKPTTASTKSHNESTTNSKPKTTHATESTAEKPTTASTNSDDESTTNSKPKTTHSTKSTVEKPTTASTKSHNESTTTDVSIATVATTAAATATPRETGINSTNGIPSNSTRSTTEASVNIPSVTENPTTVSTKKLIRSKHVWSSTTDPSVNPTHPVTSTMSPSSTVSLSNAPHSVMIRNASRSKPGSTMLPSSVNSTTSGMNSTHPRNATEMAAATKIGSTIAPRNTTDKLKSTTNLRNDLINKIATLVPAPRTAKAFPTSSTINALATVSNVTMKINSTSHGNASSTTIRPISSTSNVPKTSHGANSTANGTNSVSPTTLPTSIQTHATKAVNASQTNVTKSLSTSQTNPTKATNVTKAINATQTNMTKATNVTQTNVANVTKATNATQTNTTNATKATNATNPTKATPMNATNVTKVANATQPNLTTATNATRVNMTNVTKAINATHSSFPMSTTAIGGDKNVTKLPAPKPTLPPIHNVPHVAVSSPSPVQPPNPMTATTALITKFAPAISTTANLANSTNSLPMKSVEISTFNYVVKNKTTQVPCMLLNITVSMKISYNKTDGKIGKALLTVPQDAKSNGTCMEKTSQIILTWNSTRNVKRDVAGGVRNEIVLNFVNHGHKSTLDSVAYRIYLDHENFPGTAKSILTGNTTTGLGLFPTTVNRGHYTCNKVTDVDAGNVSFKIKNVSLIAFNTDKDSFFKQEENCVIASGVNMAAVIGGSIVGTLVVGSVIVYLCRRKTTSYDNTIIP